MVLSRLWNSLSVPILFNQYCLATKAAATAQKHLQLQTTHCCCPGRCVPVQSGRGCARNPEVLQARCTGIAKGVREFSSDSKNFRACTECIKILCSDVGMVIMVITLPSATHPSEPRGVHIKSEIQGRVFPFPKVHCSCHGKPVGFLR